MVACIIFNDDQRKFVQSVNVADPNDDDAKTGELYDTYGPLKGYLGGNQLRPVRRAGGNGNPDPCFIVGTQVLTAVDDSNNLIFGTAQPYLSGLPIINSGDPGFPGPYVPPQP